MFNMANGFDCGYRPPDSKYRNYFPILRWEALKLV